MLGRIQRWGNSLAVRLPKALADDLGISAGSVVGIEARDGQILLRPVHRYQLEDLLAQVRPEQIHAEVPTGKPRGGEVW
jgi:antitoxin MazE